MKKINIPNAVSTSDLLNLIEEKQQEEKIKNKLKKFASKSGNFTENLIEFMNEVREIKEQNSWDKNSGIFIFKDREPLFIPAKVIFTYLKDYKNMGNQIGGNIEKIANMTDFDELSILDIDTLSDYFLLNTEFEEFCLKKFNE